MKLLKNKTVEELNKTIEELERDCNTARMEKCKYKEILKDINENTQMLEQTKVENKLLKKQNKKLKQIENLFKNKEATLKKIKKIIDEEY